MKLRLPIRFHFTWFDLIGTLTLVAVAATLWNSYDPTDQRRWVALGVVVLFGLIANLHIERTQNRQEHLRLALLTVLTLLLIYIQANPSGVIVLYFVLSAQAQMTLPRRVAYGWMALWALIVLLLFLSLYDNSLAGLFSGAGIIGGMIFMGATADAQQRAVTASTESKRLLGELQRAHQQLQENATRAEALAISEERNRLAREMHDTLGHRLTVAAVQLEGAQKLVTRDPAKAEKMVATVRQEVLAGLDDLRRTVTTLRTPLEAELSLPNALTRLVNNFQQATSLPVQLALPPEVPELNAVQRQALYRTAQEGLTNAQKHAQASTIWLRLTQPTPTSVQVAVEDNGVGIQDNQATPSTGSFGLRGLSERAEQLGGQFTLAPSNQGGTLITMQLPLNF